MATRMDLRQAEEGIGEGEVRGVEKCALQIFSNIFNFNCSVAFGVFRIDFDFS